LGFWLRDLGSWCFFFVLSKILERAIGGVCNGELKGEDQLEFLKGRVCDLLWKPNFFSGQKYKKLPNCLSVLTK